MKTQLNLNDFQEILSGLKSNETADIDRVLAVLAQVSLAVLIIFVMIAILFASNYKDEAKYYKFRSDEFTSTPKSQALIELQRQKLLLALEKTNQYYRLYLGHLTFYKTNEQNQREIKTENIITGGRIRDDFIRSCNFAQKNLISVDTFRHRFIETVLSRADLTPSGMKVTSQFLDAGNKDWFRNQVRVSTTNLYEDTIRLQEDSKEGLAKYYQDNLSEAIELQELADELAIAPTKDEINSFLRKVNGFVEDELQRQNVKLLQVAQKTERQKQ